MLQARDLNAELHDAICDCEKDRVEKLIKEGADVESRDAEGKTALQSAISGAWDIDLVAILVEVGKADINAEWKYGMRCIHLACMQPHLDIIHYLLDNKVDVTAVTDEGMAGIHFAVDRDDAGILKKILLLGAEIDVQTKNDLLTPLHIACRDDKIIAAQFLLKEGANDLILNAEEYFAEDLLTPEGREELAVVFWEKEQARENALVARQQALLAKSGPKKIKIIFGPKK